VAETLIHLSVRKETIGEFDGPKRYFFNGIEMTRK
jgi:hypothetical protein